MKLQFSFSRIFLILGISIFTNLIFAAKINGTVKQHGTMSPVQFATITLIRTADETIEMGQLTGDEGYFSFINVPDGEYRIEVKFIGFDSYWSPVFNIDNHQYTEKSFGEIFIEQGSIEGEEINVTAQKKMIEVKADKKVFNLENLRATSGGTCCDVIKKVPGIEVTADGTISLRGSSNVSVLVNEKRAGILGTDGVTNAVAVPIPASMIERVEIITNPSSEFDPDGMTGIINFVLKDEAVNGYNGEITANVGHSNKLNVGSTFSYRLPQTTLFVKTNYEMAKHEGNSNNQIISFQNNMEVDRVRLEALNQRNAKLNYYNGGVKHSFSEDNLFTAEGSYIKKYADVSKQMNSSNNTVDSLWLNHSDFLNEIDAYVVGFGSYNSFDDNSNFDIEFFQDTQEENQNQMMDGMSEIENMIFQDRKILTMDYQTKVNNFQIETGYKGRFNNFQKTQADDGNINTFLYSEHINAVYGLTSFKLRENTNIKFGLRYEVVETEIDSSSNSRDGDYHHFYPSAHLIYSLSPFRQLRGSFSRRVNRPSTKQLDPYPPSNSFSQIDTIGNANLNPEFIDLIEFGFSNTSEDFKFDISSYNQIISNPIQWYESINPATQYYSYKNSGSGILNGIEGVLKFDPIHNLELRFTGNYFRKEIKGGLNENLNGITKGGYGRLIASYITHHLGELEINGTYKTKRETPQGYQWENGKFILDFAYQLSILDDHLRITFKGVDLLDSDIFESFSINNSQDSEIHSRNYEKHDQRTFYLSMVYKFGNIK